MSDSLQFDGEAVLIRPMQAEDLDQVQMIDKISFSMPWPESAYRYELFDNPASLLWVAESQDAAGVLRVVGVVVVWLVLDEAHIATIAVHPDYRGRGIAQALLCTALIGAIERGMTSATLEVRAHNLAAQRLYRRFRFEQTGLRPRYYRDNFEDALIMTANKLDQDYLRWLKDGAWKTGDERLGRSNVHALEAHSDQTQEVKHEGRG